MINWLRDIEAGHLNVLEWLGIAALGILIAAVAFLLIKRFMRLSVSVDIHRDDGTPRAPQPPAGHEKILVMDDDPLTLETMKNLLSRLGYQVVCFDSGEKTVAYMETNGADLLVLDWIMGQGIDGIETYRRIRTKRPLQRAIMLSGNASPKTVTTMRDLGVDSYLIKPISLELLATAIRAELDRP